MGSLVDSHVLTSAAVELPALLILAEDMGDQLEFLYLGVPGYGKMVYLQRTNLNLPGDEHVVELTAG